MKEKELNNLMNDLKKLDGFPNGKDKEILKISNPPDYTAFPNPYVNDFIQKYGTSYDLKANNYEKKPFVGDVSEGKNDSIYNAYSYHTKVPHKAITKFIKHYTKEGDIVYDGFCGSGMTGVAAQSINRNVILSDISVAATFISNSYNNPMEYKKFKEKVDKLLQEVEEETKWLYETEHKNNAENTRTGKKAKLFDLDKNKGIINYTVWSDVFICPYCNEEYIFWNTAVNKDTKKVKKEYECPNCNAKLTKRDCERVKEKFYDSSIDKKIEIAKQEPVLINYYMGKKRFEKELDENDKRILKKINETEIPYWYPTDELPLGYNTEQPKNSHGFTNVHHFFTKRNLWALSTIWSKIEDNNLKILLLILLANNSKMSRYGSRTGIVTGTLYVPSTMKELNVIEYLKRKLYGPKGIMKPAKKLSNILKGNSIIETNSITNSKINKNSIDYIFTDPPFGSNLMYSELNFILESWLQVFTNNETEAIVNSSQNKNLNDYTSLMTQGFKEMYKILKPNRWMTVVFHNSKAKVWNAIQESITRAGFIIAQVSTLDKKQGSFKQVTSAGAVKNDLVINAYKPKKEFEDKFLKNAGEGLEADFVKEQLKHLPVGANIERTEQMLYSKMLAHYVENGFKIKYDANNFYKLLHDNFVELDGYWFLEDQADEYSEWKSSLKLNEIEDIKKGNQVLFVVDEKSALTWINNFLDEPKDYGEIYTSYEQIATQTDDKIPELRELLDQNFILEDGKYRRPKTRKERESIEKSRTKNLERAWKKLLDRAKNGSRKIKNIRKEALIHGFTKCYQQENYEDIVTVADRLYKSTLESSGDILDFVDIARMKTE
ncbi:DNA methyltransferase [Halanaerobium congolense]|uniref:DNA methylase n=1 Tax=Halanaerobium congolense TaxID=54121 RepID=A0A1G6SKM0_9FIRM|nr:DNA methyltransferase [Halanaerobium congolense]TDS27112.1 DNA methylase [Halanaerobium congolense]SDD16666.1 DNA methylase [Halanaerobium congolense]SDK95833.1 DNA methylase [Halanaerobium congolense]SDM93991.1 DNA methylase [Halanaerobium congolense]